MPPNLRSVVAKGWRSIGSRRNFSSSRGSNEGFFAEWKDEFKEMMPPNLRCVVAQSLQGRRSIGSRRNFSSSRDSNGGMDFASLKENAIYLFERAVLVVVGYGLGDYAYEKKRSRARARAQKLEEKLQKQNQEAFQQKDDLVSV